MNLILPRRSLIVPSRRQGGFIINPYVFAGGGSTDPYFANVISLCHFTGTGGETSFTDVTGKTWTRTGEGVISTSISKFGGSSLRLDGFGDFFDCTHSDFNLGTGDFTVEMWIFPEAFPNNSILVDTRFGGLSSSYALYDSDGTSAGNMTFFANSANRAASSTLTTATWYHIALSRASGQSRFFVSGTQVGSTYADTNNYSSTQFRLGHAFNGTSGSAGGFQGWIDELRITKGVGRYTSNFTAPTAAFPDS